MKPFILTILTLVSLNSTIKIPCPTDDPAAFSLQKLNTISNPPSVNNLAVGSQIRPFSYLRLIVITDLKILQVRELLMLVRRHIKIKLLIVLTFTKRIGQFNRIPGGHLIVLFPVHMLVLLFHYPDIDAFAKQFLFLLLEVEDLVLDTVVQAPDLHVVPAHWRRLPAKLSPIHVYFLVRGRLVLRHVCVLHVVGNNVLFVIIVVVGY